jgi:hypothetical protein
MKIRNFTGVSFLNICLILGIFVNASYVNPTKVYAAPTSVNLLTANSFAVLAGSKITNTGATTINGDVGTYPTTSETGFGSITLTGTNHVGDAVTQGAKTDLVTAYNNAAGQACDTDLSGTDLGGLTLTPGVYCFSSSAQLTGMLTLNGQGNSNSVWVFKIGSTLTTASSSVVKLINGAQSCNVSWQVGSSATLGTSTNFTGNIIALTSITLNTGSAINGRALARNGAVTLDTNTITASTCTTSPTPSPTVPEYGSITAIATLMASMISYLKLKRISR